MSTKYMSEGNLALKPYGKGQTFTVIKSIKNSGDAALDVISSELFGFLNTGISSEVQATLAGLIKPKFFEGKRERRFALSCFVAGAIALFYCSFFLSLNM